MLDMLSVESYGKPPGALLDGGWEGGNTKGGGVLEIKNAVEGWLEPHGQTCNKQIRGFALTTVWLFHFLRSRSFKVSGDGTLSHMTQSPIA